MNHPSNPLASQVMGVKLRTLDLGTSLNEEDAKTRSRFRHLSTYLILSNASTLTHISLYAHFVVGQDSAWNCAIFARCSSLSSLEIYHTPQRAFEDHDIILGPGGFPRLAGVHKLPLSITSLSTSLSLIFDGRKMRDGLQNLRNLQMLTLSGVPWLLVSGTAVHPFSAQDFVDFERLFPSLHTLELGISGTVSETLLGPNRNFRFSFSRRDSRTAERIAIHRDTVFIVIDLGPRPPLPKAVVSAARPNIFRRVSSWLKARWRQESEKNADASTLVGRGDGHVQL
jgi:hypothetical protein